MYVQENCWGWEWGDVKNSFGSTLGALVGFVKVRKCTFERPNRQKM